MVTREKLARHFGSHFIEGHAQLLHTVAADQKRNLLGRQAVVPDAFDTATQELLFVAASQRNELRERTLACN